MEMKGVFVIRNVSTGSYYHLGIDNNSWWSSYEESDSFDSYIAAQAIITNDLPIGNYQIDKVFVKK